MRSRGSFRGKGLSFDMYSLEQRGKENEPHLPWTHGALTVLAVASLLMVAQARAHAQSFSDILPNAPSALLLSASVAANANALPVEDQTAAQNAAQKPSPNAPQNPSPGAPQNPSPSAPQNPSQNAPPLPPAIAPATPPPPVKPPTPGQPVQAPGRAGSATLPPCPKPAHREGLPIVFLPAPEPACADQLQLIVDTGNVKPLTSEQKGVLAVHAVTDPFNLLTIAVFSGVSVAADSHSAYGPGFPGWGRLSGYTLAEDIQIEFTGTFLLPSLVHEDPRYHRMPGAPIRRRIEHALIHTVVSQHDDGSLMPNYATLINYPLTAEISNLYVPGVATNGPSTAKRVVVGYLTDPIGPLLAEFLPDFAKRVHIHIIFTQQILNRLALGSGAQPSSF